MASLGAVCFLDSSKAPICCRGRLQWTYSCKSPNCRAGNAGRSASRPMGKIVDGVFFIQTPPKRGTLQEIKHIPLMVGIFEDYFPFPQVGYISFLNEVLVQCVFDCFCFLPGIILITRSPDHLFGPVFGRGGFLFFFQIPWGEAQDNRVLKKYHLKWSPFGNIPYACTYIVCIYIYTYNIYIYIIFSFIQYNIYIHTLPINIIIGKCFGPGHSETK